MAARREKREKPADKPPGTGPEEETTEKEELPLDGNILDEEEGGGTSGETAGHTTNRGQASKAERKNEIMTIEILKIFNS